MLDLSEDIRFNKLSFIAGSPHFKYYAGVPLRTSGGINIGSIYILDSKLRRALTQNEKTFLGIMADNVIQRLEMTRDKKDRQRMFRMNECLSAYVDPAYENGKERRRYSESTDSDSDGDSKRSADGSERIDVISRAAELLRQAMDIEEGGGGVLFLDTALAAASPQQMLPGNDSRGEVALKGPVGADAQRRNQQVERAIPEAATLRSSSPDMRRSFKNSTDVLAHTYRSVSTSPDQPEFVPFSPEELLKMLKRHPRGKMITFDQEGQELSDSSNDGSTTGRLTSRRRQRNTSAESASLHAHFPKARQILFTPVWDSTTGRSAVCFVYNCSEYRNFTHQLDLLHCITFNNCVHTELMRLANLKANEQKSDFIGSISHELRSPLHGILASCEFLQGTTCTTFQHSLVDTAASCARTLLDTVNMVLDYSKINAFEKGKVGASQDDRSLNHSEALQTSLSTHRNIDLAVLVEEVVEGVATGHAFNDPQNQALRHEVEDSKPFDKELRNDTLPIPRKPEVEIIVEISKQDWTYWCEPGAMRRIIMNLVGNSLKYTKTGFIHVELTTQFSESDNMEYGIITITDSGQGMSSTYLKDKLFTPFAQESNQAPGIGLGLSLVKSIVSALGGQITIDSTIGAGTKATVSVPLKRDMRILPKEETTLNLSCLRMDPNSIDDSPSFQMIATQAAGRPVAIYGREERGATNERDEASRLMRKSLTNYLEAWCGFSVQKWHKDSPVDVLMTEDTSLDALLRELPQLSIPGCETMILVLQNTSSMQSAKSRSYKLNNIEYVRHPLGPNKLSRALSACLDRIQSTSMGATEDKNNGVLTSSLVTEITAGAEDLKISVKEERSNEANVVDHNRLIPNEINTDIANSENQSQMDDALLSPSDHRNAVLANSRSISLPAVLEPLDEPAALPLVAEALPSTAPPQPNPPLKPNTSTRTQRVLLVDDNTINLRLLQVGMKKRGYTAISNAENGLQAVNIYRDLLHSSSPPDITLMDLSMPIMNGFEATRQIREIEAERNAHLEEGQKPHHSLIVALTGLASIRDQKEAFTAGVDSYIMKPVSFAKLTKFLEDWTVDGAVPDIAVVAE